MTSLFDDAYGSPTLVFGATPSRHLSSYLDGNPRLGVALDLGCGEGRDSIWLLKRGFKVTAVDRSTAGIEKLLRRDDLTSDIALNLRAISADVRQWDIPSDTFDLINCVTILDHLPSADIPNMVNKILRSAKDKALVFVEVHTIDDPAITGLGPISEFAHEVRYYFNHNELLHIFSPHMRVLLYEERVEWDYDHGMPHQHGFATILGEVQSERT